MILEKICTLCNKSVKVLNQDDFSRYFFRDKKGKYLHNARCKECCRKEKQKLFKKHPKKMNPNYVYKSYKKICIVCNKEFLAREEKHICCSDECKNIKNKARNKIDREKRKLKASIKRQKDIKKATVRNKHYTFEEIEIVKKYLILEKQYSFIAKKLGRTTVSVGKIARRLKNAN